MSDLDNKISPDHIKKSQTIYFHRHGLRQDILDKILHKRTWFDSERYKQHFNDVPLADPNEYDLHLNAKIINKPLDVIYCSPATRCIQTAIVLQKTLNIPIVIEYGLMEVNVVHIHALNVGFIYDETSEPIEINKIIYEKNIDKLMMPESIHNRFPDANIITNQSQINPEDMPFNMTFQDWCAMMVILIEYYKTKHTNLLFVGHATLLECCSPYIIGKSIPISRYVIGDDRTGTMSVCTSNSVNIYQGGTRIYRTIKQNVDVLDELINL